MGRRSKRFIVREEYRTHSSFAPLSFDPNRGLLRGIVSCVRGLISNRPSTSAKTEDERVPKTALEPEHESSE
jgi:hypothetical protein